MAPVTDMAASRLLRRHWREETDEQLACVLANARRSVAAFAATTGQSGSLLQSWIRGQVVDLNALEADAAWRGV